MSIADDLNRKKQLIEEKIEKTMQILDQTPEGRLICRKRNNSYRYAIILEENEKYLRMNDPFLLELAKRDYYKMYLKDLKRELKATEGYLRWHCEEDEVSRYLQKHPGISKVLQPALIDRNNRYYQWANADYPKNPNYPEHLIYKTNGGFYVRSKSEAMIANIFLEEGIPFRYEDPILLPDGGVYYVDFHMYSFRDYAEWYLEHNGRMLRDDYFNNYELKLRKLRSAGIIPGVNLLQTFEAEGYPLDPDAVRSLVHLYLK